MRLPSLESATVSIMQEICNNFCLLYMHSFRLIFRVTISEISRNGTSIPVIKVPGIKQDEQSDTKLILIAL